LQGDAPVEESTAMSHDERPNPNAQEKLAACRDQSDFELDFFGRILQRHPEHLEVVKRQAKLLVRYGRRGEALACDEQLAALLPTDPIVRYHLACSLAAVGRSEQAVRALSEAIELGYRDFEHLETDPDLDLLREHPQFQALLRGQGMGS
jgi:tetratricopeptide (TPR) repeat protein